MVTNNYDFVVCGAGLAGMIAAVSAARHGLKTALLNDRSVPGGNASSEIGVVIQGSSHHGLNYSVYAKETGLVDELRSKLDYVVARCGYDVAAACDAVFLDFLYAEPNLALYLNTVVTDVRTQEEKIAAVYAYQMRRDERLEFLAPLYADCTGDAVVAYKAGADISMGAEAKDEFNEKSADPLPQTWTMGDTLYFEIEDVGQPVPFVRPAFAYDVSKMDFMKDIDNPAKMRMLYVGGRFWTLEYGGQVNTIRDNEHIHLELRKLVFGLWDYIKNSGRFPEAENFKIKRVYSIAGSRESRRVLGDYILTETDLDQGTHFSDSVLTGGWPMDLHAPKGIYDDLPASAFIPVTAVYDIPFRCLYSRNISNLFLAGRDISTTHIALSSTRVMGTCGAMGQAVGTAAWLCQKNGVLPKALGETAITELQNELLLDDQFLIGREEYGEHALEEQFDVAADSTAGYENVSSQELTRELDSCLMLALPLRTERLDSLDIKIQNHSDCSQSLCIQILHGTKKEAYLPEKRVAEKKYSISAGFDGWLHLQIDAPRGEDGKIYLAFLPNPNLSVYGSGQMLPGAVTSRLYRARDEQGYDHNTCPLLPETGFAGQDNLRKIFNLEFRSVQPKQNIFSAENLLNGYTRPYGHMNLWLSDAAGSIVLTTPKPQPVRRMELFFDNELEDDRRNVVPSALVRDYNVWYTTTERTGKIEIRDNYLRRNIVPIDESVTQIRIELLSTNGNARFALYGIKLF